MILVQVPAWLNGTLGADWENILKEWAPYNNTVLPAGLCPGQGATSAPAPAIPSPALTSPSSPHSHSGTNVGAIVGELVHQECDCVYPL